jgi:hypothetical protein
MLGIPVKIALALLKLLGAALNGGVSGAITPTKKNKPGT